jgi:hypothetical protein
MITIHPTITHTYMQQDTHAKHAANPSQTNKHPYNATTPPPIGFT